MRSSEYQAVKKEFDVLGIRLWWRKKLHDKWSDDGGTEGVVTYG
jgi:hypothetical protein